jgi:hypothetical protein
MVNEPWGLTTSANSTTGPPVLPVPVSATTAPELHLQPMIAAAGRWPDAHTTRPQAQAQHRSAGPERRASLFRHVTYQTPPHRQNVHHGPHPRCAPPERCYASAWSMSVMGCTVGTPALARCIAQPGLALATASGVWRSISATLRSRICPASSGCSTE